MYELNPRFDGRKSFYGKAKVVIKDGESHLYSYNTHVATLKPGITKHDDILEVYGTYSPTTLRHIKEFMQQNGFPYMSKGEIEHLIEPSPKTRKEINTMYV